MHLWLMARWKFGETEDEFFNWLKKVPDSIFRLEFPFSVEPSPLILFDSALEGRNAMKSICRFGKGKRGQVSVFRVPWRGSPLLPIEGAR
jgi:hypothetical protein